MKKLIIISTLSILPLTAAPCDCEDTSNTLLVVDAVKSDNELDVNITPPAVAQGSNDYMNNYMLGSNPSTLGITNGSPSPVSANDLIRSN